MPWRAMVPVAGRTAIPRVQPAARRVMDEIGTPLRQEGPSESAERDDASEEVVVIRNRGVPPFSNVMSWSFDDPSEPIDETMRLKAFRRVRDEIKRRVDLLLLVKASRRAQKGTVTTARAPRAP